MTPRAGDQAQTAAELLHTEEWVRALGALTGNQADLAAMGYKFH
jgi:hypothetical protein